MHQTPTAAVVQMRSVRPVKVNLSANGLDGNPRDLAPPHAAAELYQNNASARTKSAIVIVNYPKTSKKAVRVNLSKRHPVPSVRINTSDI